MYYIYAPGWYGCVRWLHQVCWWPLRRRGVFFFIWYHFWGLEGFRAAPFDLVHMRVKTPKRAIHNTHTEMMKWKSDFVSTILWSADNHSRAVPSREFCCLMLFFFVCVFSCTDARNVCYGRRSMRDVWKERRGRRFPHCWIWCVYILYSGWNERDNWIFCEHHVRLVARKKSTARAPLEMQSDRFMIGWVLRFFLN